MKYLLEIKNEGYRQNDELHGYDTLEILKHHLEVNDDIRYCIWSNTNPFGRIGYRRLTVDEMDKLLE